VVFFKEMVTLKPSNAEDQPLKFSDINALFYYETQWIPVQEGLASKETRKKVKAGDSSFQSFMGVWGQAQDFSIHNFYIIWFKNLIYVVPVQIKK
jgi:hypothetical protein